MIVDKHVCPCPDPNCSYICKIDHNGYHYCNCSYCQKAKGEE